MSVNYYVHTPDGQEIHLGQHTTVNGFTFRAHPDRQVTTYEAWLQLLDLGEIRAEHGREVSVEEMLATADERGRFTPHWVGQDGFIDGRGRRFLSVEFC